MSDRLKCRHCQRNFKTRNARIGHENDCPHNLLNNPVVHNPIVHNPVINPPLFL